MAFSRWLRGVLRALRPPSELPFATGERRLDISGDARAADGIEAEQVAAEYLRRKRYRILCRNRVNAGGELDIVARDGETIVFVEVRSRHDYSPVEVKDTITRKKRQTLTRAAEMFIRQHRIGDRPVRLDLVSVSIDSQGGMRVTEHIEAFIGADGK